ncbi:MAG TPA: hypothetical protein VEJ84_09345 [Acidimicrobiales bacterium]|nr:hypothetical protein [Acidimicrobiales bacterium]
MRRVLIIAGIVLVVVLVGWYEGLYKPESAHINALRAKEQVAAANLTSLEGRYIALVDAKRRVPAERKALATLEQLVPDEPGLDSLVKVIFKLTATAGLQLQGITSPSPSGFGQPASPSGSTAVGPNELLLTISVAGTAKEVERLYQLLESNSRLFVIDNYSLSFSTAKNGASAGNQTSLEVRAFFASPNPNTAVS